MGSRVRSWTLTIPAPDGKVMGSNHDHRAHWGVVNAHRQAAKAAAAFTARQAGIPRLGHIGVIPVVHLSRWRTTDPHNLPGGSTLKGSIDGLADEQHICTLECSRRPGGCPLRGQRIREGIVASDGPDHMTVRTPRLAPLGKARSPWVALIITEQTRCANCRGKGSWTSWEPIPGQPERSQPYDDHTCPVCDGDGWVSIIRGGDAR